jgi:fibronectin type 3 domain-containing protein
MKGKKVRNRRGNIKELSYKILNLFVLMVFLGIGCSGSKGTTGERGPAGPAGPAAPTMPVIQSISVVGLPAKPGSLITAAVIAQSASNLALTYTWTTSSGDWQITRGGDSPTATITAPYSYGITGTATVEVSDTQGGYALGVIALSTEGNTYPVISSITASPNPVVPNGTITALVNAYDPDGDKLSYIWGTTAGWTITGYGATATVIAPATYNTDGYITVTVSDNYGGVVTGTIAVGTIIVIPSSPINLIACAGNQQVTLTWNTSLGATSYNIYQSFTSGGPYTKVASSTNTNYTVTGLTNGDSYYFVVTAVNSAGESAALNQTSATVGTLPLPPSSLFIDTSSPKPCGSNYTLLLKWSESTCANSYTVYQSTSSGGQYTGIGTTTSTSFRAANLVNGTDYYFVVTAVNNAGESGYSNQVGMYFSIPAAPTDLQYSLNNDNCFATFVWGASPDALSYNIYEATTNFLPIFFKLSNTTSTTYTANIEFDVNNLCFEVTAVGSVLESCPSNFVCFPIPNACMP